MHYPTNTFVFKVDEDVKIILEEVISQVIDRTETAINSKRQSDDALADDKKIMMKKLKSEAADTVSVADSDADLALARFPENMEIEEEIPRNVQPSGNLDSHSNFGKKAHFK